MSESLDDEREQIRERKKRELLDRLEDGPAGEDRAGGADAPDEPIAIEGRDHFDSIVASHDVVLVDCYADWCGPCKMLEPTIEALAAETPAAVAKVDTEAQPFLAQQLGVQGLPTLLLYVDGDPVKRLVGVQDRATLEGLIDRYA